MSLMTKWSPFFQSAVRMSGRTLQLDSKVKRVEPVGEELIRAIVDDNETHTVTFEQDGRHAVAECDCPHFRSGAYCKHVWAALEGRKGISGIVEKASRAHG